MYWKFKIETGIQKVMQKSCDNNLTDMTFIARDDIGVIDVIEKTQHRCDKHDTLTSHKSHISWIDMTPYNTYFLNVATVVYSTCLQKQWIAQLSNEYKAKKKELTNPSPQMRIKLVGWRNVMFVNHLIGQPNIINYTCSRPVKVSN